MEETQSDRSARVLAQGERGMTLIEIMIVLAIIALVMGFLVGPRVFRSFGAAKEKTCKLEVHDLAYQAYPRWAADNEDADCPASLDELKTYANKQTFKDPWGSKYVMRCGEGMPEDIPFGVMSLGRDRKEGTDDDIRSWDTKK